MSQAPTLPALLAHLRSYVRYALGFSVFVNLMLLGPTLYMLQVFDRVLTSRSEATLLMLSVGVVIALVAMSIVDAARAHLLVELGRRVDERLGETMLRHVVRQTSAAAPGESSIALRDVGALRVFLSGTSVLALFDAPWMLVFVVVIFLFHPALGALALGGAVLLVALAWLTERSNRSALEQLAAASRQGSQFIDQGLRNADVLNAMGMATSFASRWNRLNGRTLDLMQASGGRGAALLAVTKFMRQALQAAMLGLGAWLVLDSSITPGIIIAATILFGRAMAPVEALIGSWGGLVAARAAWRRLSAAVPAAFEERRRTPLPPPQGRVQLERVALAGIDPDNPILRLVDFDLPAGKSLGILGPSGAGKSSLAKVLVGIWPASAGKVRIDGAEIDQWDPRQLGPCIGYLPQDVELFPGTIADNIARFTSDAGEDVVEAARRAHAYDLVLRLPQGFETRIGEGGIRLSAGQAQRIGLARALFRRPRIVVLDEPNANLDAEGEQALLQALADMRQEQVTVVMVTHKPSLVGTLDYLLLLRDGRIELMGPRDEVLARLAGSAPAAAALRSAA